VGNESLTQEELIVFMVLGYLNELTEKGLIEGGEYIVTEQGKSVIALCEEFDFKPKDVDILCTMEGLEFEEKSKESIFKLIQAQRDRKI
jgi:hypothetical protein